VEPAQAAKVTPEAEVLTPAEEVVAAAKAPLARMAQQQMVAMVAMELPAPSREQASPELEAAVVVQGLAQAALEAPEVVQTAV